MNNPITMMYSSYSYLQRASQRRPFMIPCPDRRSSLSFENRLPPGPVFVDTRCVLLLKHFVGKTAEIVLCVCGSNLDYSCKSSHNCPLEMIDRREIRGLECSPFRRGGSSFSTFFFEVMSHQIFWNYDLYSAPPIFMF